MFTDRLAEAVRAKESPLMVGIDPRRGNLPAELQPPPDATLEEVADAFRRFAFGVIDAVVGETPIIKPQAAFFEQLGPPGMQALGDIIHYGRDAGLLVCIDGKRNDIGSTAEAYADGWLGETSVWQGDALTVSPYLGDDSLTPFVDVARARDAGIFVLVKTSNPGGALWQDLDAEGQVLYARVGQHVEAIAAETAGECGYGVAGAVVGATYPQQLAELRSAMPHTWLLIPGFGAQGGSAADVAAGFDKYGLGAVVNSSRGVIFAYEKAPSSDWRDAVRDAARSARQQLLAATPAGQI